MESTTSPDLLADLKDEVVFEHATKAQRFVNFLIDGIISYVLMIIGGVILGAILVSAYIADTSSGNYSDSPVDGLFFNVMVYSVTISILVGYYTIMEAACKGRTIGKMVTGTVALRADGSKLTWKHAFLRSLVRLIPFEPLVALFTNYPWHDDLTSTVVVKKQG